MAKKHRTVEAAGPDPDGEAWMAEAGKRWEAAVAESARLEQEYAGRALNSRERREAARARRTAFELYDAPALPDFRKAAAKHIEGDVLGRFVYQPGRELVHDVTTATPQCRIEETPRVFVHFASELETAVPEEAEPHSCMAGAG